MRSITIKQVQKRIWTTIFFSNNWIILTVQKSKTQKKRYAIKILEKANKYSI